MLRSVAWGAAILVVLLALLIVEENWRGKHAFESYQHQLESQGEHFDFAHFAPPEVPDEKNFAMAPVLKALSEYSVDPKTNAMIPSAPDAPVNKVEVHVVLDEKAKFPMGNGGREQGLARDLTEWQTYYREALPDAGLTGSAPEDVLKALGRYDAIFDELRAAAQERPASRFPLHYQDGVEMRIPHYTALQSMEKVLAMRAVAAVQAHRPDQAFADLRLGFRLYDSIKGEPLLISGLVRITFMAMLLQPVWEGIASHQWSDGQLQEIKDWLARLDFLEDYETTMRADRAASALYWSKLRAGQLRAWDATNSERFALQTERWFTGLTWQNQYHQYRTVQDLLGLVDVKAQRVNWQGWKNSKAATSKETQTFSPYTFMARNSVASYHMMLQKCAMAQTWANLAIIACVLERHRLQSGDYPETLQELSGDLPHDVMNGEPMHYRREGQDNYTLYSVGKNGIDDGGKLARVNNTGRTIDYEQGDIVWSLKPF